MALNQLLKIGKHAIKIHNMIDDSAEMEAWVAKKIDLAGDYVKKVHGYMQGEKAGLYDDGGLTEDASDIGNEIAKIYDDVVAYLQDVSDNPADDEGDLRSGYDGDDVDGGGEGFARWLLGPGQAVIEAFEVRGQRPFVPVSQAGLEGSLPVVEALCGMALPNG